MKTKHLNDQTDAVTKKISFSTKTDENNYLKPLNSNRNAT